MVSVQDFLISIFAHNIEGTEPEIVELEQLIKIIGMSMETNVKSASRDIAQLGKRLQRCKQQNDIPNKKKPWGFAAPSKDFDEKRKTFWYMMGDVVTGIDEVPSGMEAFEIPAGMYAVFPVRPRNRFGWGMAIVNVKKYAYEVWLPSSEYEAAGTIDDFEYHDQRSTRKKNPQIDLYIAIRQKD